MTNFVPPSCFSPSGLRSSKLCSGLAGSMSFEAIRYSSVAAAPSFFTQATRSPNSLRFLSFCGVPSVWQFMQRKRQAQTFFSNDSSIRSLRAWRMTSTGRVGTPRSFSSSFGADFNFGSAAHAAIHATKASRSALRALAWTAFGPCVLPPPMSMSFTIFDFSGASRSINPWSRRLRNVFSASGRM